MDHIDSHLDWRLALYGRHDLIGGTLTLVGPVEDLADRASEVERPREPVESRRVF